VTAAKLGRLQVIDKNFFEDPMLDEFLNDDVENRAVITDFASMESYKGDALKNISRSISILSRYSNQVLVLKPTPFVRRIGRIQPEHRFNLIDWNQSRHFGRFCEDVKLAEDGDPIRLKAIHAYGMCASEHLVGMLEIVPAIAEYIEYIRAKTSSEAIKARMNQTALSAKDGLGILEDIKALSHRLLQIDKLPIPETWAEARDWFLVRFAVATHLLALRWVGVGGTAAAKPNRIRNDLVDVSYAVYATYFDGLLSADDKLNSIYLETDVLLERFFTAKEK
jgi:hypothetical protein